MPASCVQYNSTIGVCGGGALALDGRTGAVLWTFWTRKDILFVDCGANVNADKTKDCLLSGQGGVLSTVDGHTGNLIWELAKPIANYIIDDYSAQYVPDVDNDGITDVLVTHTSDQSAHVLVLNGRNGQIIGRIETPNKESVFTAPRLTVRQDGSYLVVFATGNADSPGNLYAIPLYNLAVSDATKCVNIWTDKVGVTSGLVLADMNYDGMEDIVVTSGDKLSVLSGIDFSFLWNITLTTPTDPMQIFIGPTPAYFDDDLTPDLLITNMVGPSFPTYYYSETWVANGKGGSNLLDKPILGTGDITAPGVTVSYTGIGNDMYLYWLTTCNQPNLQSQTFTFAQGSTTHEQLHADLCRLRFNSSLEVKLYVLNQHIEPPGILLYSSNHQWDVEHNYTETSSIKPEIKNTESWTPPRPSSFRHNFQQKPIHYQFPLNPGVEEPPPVMNYPRFQHGQIQTQDWEPQPVSYSDSTNGFPGINLGDLAMDYGLAYPQESEGEDTNFNIGEGRDERASKFRPRRSVQHNYPSLSQASSTATLASPLSGNGIDIVFATHWEFPSSNVRILTEKDQECVQRKISAAQNTQNKLTTLGVKVLQETAERECLGLEGESAISFDGGLGQMTLYRLNLNCKCLHIKESEEVCSTPLSMDQQSYSHRAGDVYFKRRSKTSGKN